MNVVARRFGDINPPRDLELPKGDPVARAQIQKMLSEMESAPSDCVMGEDEFKTDHYFSDGVYCRQIFLPKGVFVVGKIHRTSHLNIISTGDVTVRTQYGIDRLKGPCTFKSEVWTQRAVLAHEDTIWTCVHPTELTDVDEIEADIIAKSYDEYDKLLEGGVKWLG